MPAEILMNRNQARCAATSEKFAAHHWSESLGGNHHNIDIFARNDRSVINRKAVREEQRLTATQIGSDLFSINNWYLGV